jgi:dihydropteroate synthase
MAQDTVFYQKIARIFDQKTSPVIMGILNITPDSFYDGGKYVSEEDWLSQVGKMIAEGADIIDIGAYSTRPGATNINAEEEEQRLIKAIVSVRKQFPEILISADTFRAIVAEKAVMAGANLINDVSGGTLDNKMFELVARLQVPYVLMHIQGTPQTMQVEPIYEDVLAEVIEFLKTRLLILQHLGAKHIIVDPGFGFGKTLEHNIELMRNLEKFRELNAPLLIGVSRKSIVNKILNINTKDSLNGTTVLNTIALGKGAKILRVHDVKEAKEAVVIVDKMKSRKGL